MSSKGKQRTKGQKQIIEENASTLQFYLYIAGGATGVYLTVQYFFFWETFTMFYMGLYLLSNAVYFGSYQFISKMAQVTHDTSSGAVVDGGIDINMENGMAEHMKDLMLLTSIVQLLSLLSNYFWLFYLLVPGRAFHLLWVNILSPWFFAEAPEIDEKKQKKKERKRDMAMTRRR